MDKETRKRLTKKRWLVLIASCLINLCIGSLYAWSVFASPLAEKFNGMAGGGGAAVLTAANLAIVFTVANSVGPVTMISGGSINDRLGPKWVVFIGGILFGAGLLACGFANSIPMLVTFYGFGCGLGMGLVYGCTISNSVKFFPDMRGLIGGITTATYGLSSVLIPPIANRMIEGMGISSTLKVLGIVFLAVICGCSFFIEQCPLDFAPEGWRPQSEADTGFARKAGNDKNWKEMLKDPVFYLMILMLMCGAFSGLMITSQASPMAQGMAGMSVGMAAVTVSVLALFNAAGRVMAGYLSDKIGRINVLSMAFAIEFIGLGFILFTQEGDTMKFIAGVSVMGLCFGSFMGVYPGFTADQFGIKNNSVNYGIMFIGFALAGFLGPTVVGKIVSATGSYEKGFYIAATLALFGAVLSVLYRKKKR